MKNYFAKLVARTAPLHDSTPVARESTRIHDPFEQVAAPEMPEPPQKAERGTTSSTTVIPSRVVNGFADEKRSAPPIHPAPLGPTNDDGRLLQSELSASPTPEKSWDSPPQTVLKSSELVEATAIRKPFDEAKTDPEESLPKSIQPNEVAAALSREHESNQQVANPQQAQAILLHKADTFMKDLLEEDAGFQSGRDLEGESEFPQAEDLHTLNQTIENPRLKPTQAPELTHEQDTEQSSLVIGKLTVEVIPSTSPPATLRPQRIVVRRPMSTRSSLISSRRFGLGQF